MNRFNKNEVYSIDESGNATVVVVMLSSVVEFSRTEAKVRENRTA